MTDEDLEDVKAAHDLAVSLRNDGYTVGFDSDDVVEDFDQHVQDAQELLEADDLSGFFVVAHREGQTDYASSVVVNDSVAWGVVQIEMLGSHFRTIVDALPLGTTELVESIVDEALTIDDVEDDGNA